MKANILKDNERLDDLEYENLKIIQNKSGYKFSTDSVLLSNFGKAKQNDIYVDLCSGSGVVAILFSCKNKIKKSFVVELQKELSEMAKRSVEYNGLSDKISVLNADLKSAHQIIGYEKVDVITVNPPYNIVVGDIDESQVSIATHEIKTNLRDVCEESKKLLKYGGKLFMVHRADRLVDILFELRKNELEPKRLRIVYPKETKEPNLVLIEAKKGSKPGIKILEPLILNNADGSETDELKRIYCRKN